jgi:hypothetical protein
VAYQASGTSVIPKDAYAIDKDFLDRDQTFPAGLNCVLDFGKGRFRIEWKDKILLFPHMILQPHDELWTYTGGLRVHYVGVSNNPAEFSEQQPDFGYETTNFPVLTLRQVARFGGDGYFHLPLLAVTGKQSAN